MNIHEYQAKELMRSYGVAVPEGKVAFSPEEAKKVAEGLGTGPFAVKAQIHAGGRGKAGGIKIVNDAEGVYKAASELIGKTLVTHQTGPQGKVVRKVLVEKASKIKKEFYLGVVIDRAKERVVIMGSSEGGVEIEEVAKRSPEKIIKIYPHPFTGLKTYHALALAKGMGIDSSLTKDFSSFVINLYRLFIEKDCSLAEINPLILTEDGKLMALDAKINFDDSALFRHPDIAQLRDVEEEDPKEVEASKFKLNYISLDGTIGCLVNGAGLAMSTMDILKYYGGEPANFLDVGGGASKEAVTQAFRIILKDPKVRAIFVNIFGGIMRCDIIASGLVEAAKELGIKVPLIVRLEGTNVEEARKILSQSGLKIELASDMADGGKKAVEAAKKVV